MHDTYWKVLKTILRRYNLYIKLSTRSKGLQACVNFQGTRALEVALYVLLTLRCWLVMLMYRSSSPLSSGQMSNRPLKGEIVTVWPSGRMGRLLVRPPSIHFCGRKQHSWEDVSNTQPMCREGEQTSQSASPSNTVHALNMFSNYCLPGLTHLEICFAFLWTHTIYYMLRTRQNQETS